MKHISSLLLAAAIGVGVPALAHAQVAQGAPATANRGAKRNEAHPRIHEAIKALDRAKYDLQHAAHDFGGHRADAVRSVDEAIRQLNLALQYDKK